MKKLSREGQQQAREFIFTQARPLEQRLYAIAFEGGAREAALQELATFQNPDGGFGHGIEPDLRLADSSALATTVGLQHLRALGATSEHRLVKGAMGYLLRTYNAQRQVWPIIPPNTDEAPHAPWWTYSDDIADKWRGFLANPRAEIVGYLWEHTSLAPADLRVSLTEAAVLHLAKFDSIPLGDDLLCYIRLAETPALPEIVRSELWAKLVPLADKAVNRDETTWGTYVVSPLKLIESPDSPLMAALGSDVERHLDYEIDHQQEDGSWAPTWSWFGLYTDDWPQACREWQGVLTLRMLRILKAFARLA